MTKRSAITMAAGLALALLVGVAAITLTMSGGATAHAGGHRKPKIEHRVQTVTIHRKASGAPAPTTRVVHLPSSTAPAAAPSTGSSGYSEGESQATDDAEGSGSHAESSGAEVGDD
jgi:hypothetical protein